MSQQYYVARAYARLRALGLNPRDFLRTFDVPATKADIEALPDEDWLRQVEEEVRGARPRAWHV